MKACAEELEGTHCIDIRSFTFAAWPDGPSRANWPGIVYFVVRPKWIRYSDFDQNLPLIEEFTF